MNTDSLVSEIESVSFKEFWYGSKLLAEAEKYKEHDLTEEKFRVTKALVMRHHYLQNKSAGSCIVLRRTIKDIQGIYLNTLWEMLLSDDADESDAASFIIGEIGGVGAFQYILNRLRDKKEELYPKLIPCLTHVIGRYYQILDETEPTAELMDTKTGEIKTVSLKEFAPDKYNRTIMDRSSMNEFFYFTTDERVDAMSSLLSEIPEGYFVHSTREDLVGDINNLKKIKTSSGAS